MGEFDTAEDRRQFRCRHAQVGRGGGGKGERAALQSAQVKGEAVALPGQDLETVPAPIAEDKEVAAEWVAGEVRGHDGGQAVDALAAVLRPEADPNPPGQAESQHGTASP